MGKVENFEDYGIWKEARALCQEIFVVTSRAPFCNDFSLKGQINKSSGSIMDNIAEGHERGGNKEFISFLSIARGSSGEVKSQLFRALDRNYISDAEFHALYHRTRRIGAGLTNLMKYLRGSDNKGFKFD